MAFFNNLDQYVQERGEEISRTRRLMGWSGRCASARFGLGLG